MIAAVAQWALLVPALLVAGTIVVRRRWRIDVTEAVVAGIATIAFVKLAGALRFEQRPFVLEHLHPLVPHAPDNAFPSDHLAAAGLAFAYLWPRSKPLAIVVLVFAAAIGAARVLAHLHWPVDIVAGFVIGAVATELARAVLRRTSLRGPQRRHATLRRKT